MPKRRDVRRFGRGPYILGFERATRAGAQFVIATHSPILLARPDAKIYELGDAGIARCEYDDLDAVRLTRGFLDAPERYLRAALGDAG
jgi:predicted ATPase